MLAGPEGIHGANNNHSNSNSNNSKSNNHANMPEMPGSKFSLPTRFVAPDLGQGKDPLVFRKHTYEADKALDKMMRVTQEPLTKKDIQGRQVQPRAL